MTRHDRWQERYREKYVPWDTGRPDSNLIDIVTGRPIPTGKTLEIGCGTGTNTVWLAQQGFSVTATDISEIAIQKAKQRASSAGVPDTFIVIDFLADEIPDGPFQLVFDRGCFHSFDSYDERSLFAKKVATHLDTNGLWISIIGNADGPPRKVGPPRLTAQDIVTVVEPHFEILSLTSTHFDSNQTDPPRAWLCLMQKRNRWTGE